MGIGSVFISHKHKDQQIARVVADFIEEESGNRVDVFLSWCIPSAARIALGRALFSDAFSRPFRLKLEPPSRPRQVAHPRHEFPAGRSGSDLLTEHTSGMPFVRLTPNLHFLARKPTPHWNGF